MIVYFHPSQRLHDPSEPHLFGGESLPPAEVAERADRVLSGLDDAGGFEVVEPALVDMAELADTHTARYLAFLEDAHRLWREAVAGPVGGEALPYVRPLPGTPWKEPKGVLAQLGRFSNDVDPILAGTWEAALASASSAAAGAEYILNGGESVYALCRPPGHHAGPETYGGYCFVNNAAVAARRLRAAGRRVAILDLDAHHGNGTQTIFWNDPDVLTISIHGDPDENYPFFLGYADETGGAQGSNRNYPLATGSVWETYREAVLDAINVIGHWEADSLVVPLGVDTHVAHGVVGLGDRDFPALGELVGRIDLPTLVVQEGGYAPGTLERAVPDFLSAMLTV